VASQRQAHKRKTAPSSAGVHSSAKPARVGTKSKLRDAPGASDPLQAIYRVVRAIPRGTVATYGQLALLAGIPSGHRIAARAMRCCPDGLPWYRVLAKKDARRAKIAMADPDHAREQQQRLRGEGVTFDGDGYVGLRQFGWLPVEACGPAREPNVEARRPAREPNVEARRPARAQDSQAPSQKRAKPARTAAENKKNR
jgi:methylated-DNA-protein-cysteine methyltransferase-like protein